MAKRTMFKAGKATRDAREQRNYNTIVNGFCNIRTTVQGRRKLEQKNWISAKN